MKKKTRGLDVEVEKIPKFYMRKVGMIFLWIILTFIFLRGVIAIFTSISPSDQKRMLDEYTTSLQSEENIRTEVTAFAESFVRDYFTYDGASKEAYEMRLADYMASGLLISAPENIVMTTNYVSAIGVNFESENDIDVDITATVNYTDSTKNVIVRVPIEVDKNGKLAIVNLPQFIPKSDKSDAIAAYQKNLPGREVTKEELSDIQTNLESFFKTYFEGNRNELSYYVTKDFPYENGLEGTVKFATISTLRVSFDDSTSKYYAVANLDVIDNERTIEQTVYLTLKKTDRFYVEDIATR